MNKPLVSPPAAPERPTAIVSSCQARIKGKRQVLAPSLASAAVLLAMMGLSQEALMQTTPEFSNTPVRQRTVSELARSPSAASPATGFVDGLAAEDDRADFEVRQEIERKLGAVQKKPAKQENRRFAESSQKAQPALDAPLEEALDAGSRLKADLSYRDQDLMSPDELPGLSENEKADQGHRVVNSQSLMHKTKDPQLELTGKESGEKSVTGGSMNRPSGFQFLAHYQQTEDLYFQPGSGYWANTYIPGDPAIRLLKARLAQQDRSWLGSNSALERDIEPLQQPFDASANNALALSLMADTDSITSAGDGATRMRLQVGIRGIEHRHGQRPAMNVGIVVDLPADATDDVRIACRSLLDALLQSQQAGDRFSLVIAGTGLVVEAEDFRFGSLQLAKQQILGQGSQPGDSGVTEPALELRAALRQASAMVGQTDEPGRPLGSSSVLLISANSLSDVEQTSRLVHENAKEGITLSVVPLGSKPQHAAVEELVLAGLGNRRYLEAPGQARQLIEEELHASSRAVARAARLSVRLAPGVRLIGVVGSERLDLQRASRVREIETSMDRRLSANLGIQADRGEDEDGIQIVIPGIFSGDSVTVLLDVVTDRPGAIADVSLRYKDLVFLRNGSLQAHLELPDGAAKRGPAELSVLKNLLSRHFVEAVEQAAAALGRQQPAAAIAALAAMRSTIEQARRDVPAWASNRDLMHDQQVLDHYLAALNSPQAGAHQSFLTDSLLVAAWAKSHRSPEEWKL